MRTAVPLILIAAIALFPTIALACPVCFAAGGSRAYWAYYVSTILLSAMPFVLIGVGIGAAYLLRNRRAPVRELPPAN